MTDAEYIAWMTGTLQGVAAPADSVNNDTLWAWSGAEGGRVHMNPLNTTQWAPGAVAWNTLPSGAHVWTYPDVATAVSATVATLLNGYYSTIVAHLRASTPRQQWGDACHELGLWGTGCAWISLDYGSPPVFGGGGGSIGGQELTDSELDFQHDVAQLGAFGSIDTSAQSYADFRYAVRNGQSMSSILSGWRSSAAGQAWTAHLAAAGAPGPKGDPGPPGEPGPAGTFAEHVHGFNGTSDKGRPA